MDGFQRKSFNIIISASSAPTQAKVPVAGLQNVSYMAFNGESMKLLPQICNTGNKNITVLPPSFL